MRYTLTRLSLSLGLLLSVCAAATVEAQGQQPRRTPPPTTPQQTLPLQQLSRMEVKPEHSTAAIGDVPYQMPKRTATEPGQTLRIPRQLPGAQMSQGAQYDLFYLADDLAPGERYYVGKKIHSDSGTQMWGYDVGAMKYASSTDTWSEVKSSYDSKNAKNSDYVVYGKPVYAMGPGKIIRCWRNAPENPRPYSGAMGDSFDQKFEDRKWLHQSWRDKKMAGGGNHLLVEETDGSLILYAHAQPGSIPSALCPHNAQLFSKADAISEADVPEAQQKTIKAGDFLFRTGNSGNSSAPHLHVHKEKDSQPVQMQFRRGLSTPVTGNFKKADINKWTRFAGKRIPDGPVLIWPPRRLGAEYARHGFPAGDFQRMFDHLADSGYWPEWIDGYSVGGKVYLNYVWRPSKGQWRAFFLLTPQDYQTRFSQATADKFYPVHVESSLVGSQVRYSAIFVKDKPGGYLARHDRTYDQHMAIMNEAKSKNLFPVNVSVVSVGGQLRYTVLYRSENIGKWEVKSRVKEADYQALYNQNGQAGRRPVYVNAYMHQGTPFYSVIFSEQPSGQRKDRHGLTSQTYQSEFNSALNGGLLTRAVSGYDGAKSNHRYIAFWRK